jgi:hypothetical protein
VRPESATESPNFFDEPFDFEEPFDLVEPAEASGGAPPGAETPEKRRRRRRRRRPGRESEGRTAGEPAAGDELEQAGDLPSADMMAEEQEPMGAERPVDESDEYRREYRRPPRERRPPPSGRRPPAAAAPPPRPGVEPLDADVEDLLQTDIVAGEGLDEEAGEEPGGDRPARIGFRGIPTWEEAVGMLITKNIEARARRPAGGPSHGRGNRDNRGRNDRDNRGRGGDRSRGSEGGNRRL